MSAWAGLELPGTNQDDWVDPRQPLEIRFHIDTPGVSRGRLHFLFGKRDLTGLLKRLAPGQYLYPADQWPLPPGEETLRVYRVADGVWTLLDERPLRVLSSGGFEQAEWTPQADLSGSGRVEHSLSSDFPDEQRLQDKSLALQAGMETRHNRRDIQMETRWQWVGSSSAEQSLRYDQLGPDAPRIDLSDYQIHLQRRSLGLRLGHQEQGANPLLIDRFRNRGLGLSWQPSDTLSLQLAAQAARPRVGWSDLLGLADASTDRVASLGLGLRLPGPESLPLLLRVDLISALRVAEPGFDEAAVTELANNRGLGLRLLAGGDDLGWSLHIDYARSRFENPPEPFELEFGEQPQTLVSKDEARAIGLRYTLLKMEHDDPDAPSLDLLLDWSRIDPFYQSIAAELTPNEQRQSVTLEGRWRWMNWRVAAIASEDNLDDLPSVLKTLTREQQLSLNLDLSALETVSAWIPGSATLSLGRIHQFGDNLPIGFDPDSHVPDQVDRQQSLDLEWLLPQGNLSVRLARSVQDNRQPGRDQADFENRELSLSLSTALIDGINLQLGWGQVLALDMEQDLERRSREWQVGMDALLGEHWSLSVNGTLTLEDDDQGLSERKNHGLQLQVSRQWQLPSASGKLPLQAFLRYTRNDDDSVDRLFDVASEQQSRAWDLGFSLSFF